MFYLYILQGPKGHLYVGVTKNIPSRIERHKQGVGAEFAKRNRCYALIYNESYKTLIEARRRETQIKKWSRIKKENLIRCGHPYSLEQ